MKSTSHSDTPTNDQKRPLRDRLLEFRGRCLSVCAEENIKSTVLPDMFLEAVDELDRLSPQSTHIEVMKKDAQVEMRKEIITLRKCLELAEARLKFATFTDTLNAIQKIKEEGGIE